MIDKEIMRDLVQKYNNNSYAEKEKRLFVEIANNVKERKYLKKEEFLEIVRWKSVRAIRKAENNPKEIIEEITKLALEVNNEEVKIRVLTSLKGVSIPMASSILTIVNPEKYGVIDIRAWHSLYNLGLINYKKDTFNIKDWLLYLNIIRKLAGESNLTPREIDKALFMYDKINRQGNLYN